MQEPAVIPARTPAQFKPWRSLAAVVTGVIVDLGGTNIVGGCYTVVIMFPLMMPLLEQGLSQAEMQVQLQQQVNEAMNGSIFMWVLGALLSILGGYVAGRIARHAETLHGLTVGVGVTLISTTLTLALGLPSATPLWRLLLGLALNWGATALGGFLAEWQRTRAKRRASAAA